jgi:hypothetical protein
MPELIHAGGGGLSNSTKATLNVPTWSARIWYIMIG